MSVYESLCRQVPLYALAGYSKRANSERHVSVPGPKITGAELWSMGGDGIVVDGAFALVIAVDAEAQTLTLAMDSAAAPCALAERSASVCSSLGIYAYTGRVQIA